MKTHIYNVNNYKIIYVPIQTDDVLVGSLVKFSEIHEDKELCGISHLLEHVLLNSWDKYKPYVIPKVLLEKGLDNNAATFEEYVTYYGYGHNRHGSFLIDYIGDIMTKAKIVDKVVNTEKKSIRQELLGYLQSDEHEVNQHVLDTFVPNSSIALNNNMKFLIKNLKNLTPSVVRKFYKNAYIPNNITFIILGNKSKRIHLVNQLKKKLRKSNGNNSICNMYRLPKLILTNKPKFIDITRSDMVKSSVYMVFVKPTESSLREALVLDMVGYVLTSSLGSVLYQILRIKEKLVYEIRSQIYHGSLFEYITFKFTCDTSKVNKIVLIIKKVIEDISFTEKHFNGLKEMFLRDIKEDCSTSSKGENVSSQWIKYGKIESLVKITKSINMKEILNEIKKIIIFNKVFIVHQSPNKFPIKQKELILKKLS